MTTITQPLTTSHTAASSLNWLKQGWQLMCRSPFKLFLFLLFPLLLEGLIQLLPAPYSMLMSKWMMAFVAAAVWPLLRALDHSGRFNLTAIFRAQGWYRMALLAVVMAVPFAFQLGVADVLLGPAAIDMLLFGELMPVANWQLGLIFASAVPFMALLQFVPASVLLGQHGVAESVSASLRLFSQAWRPLLVIALVHAIVLFLAPYTLVLSVLISAPWLAATSYRAYVNLVDENQS